MVKRSTPFILAKEYDNAKQEWVYKLNAKSPLATEVWFDELDWWYYTYKVKPTIATHAQEVSRQATAARAAAGDDGDDDFSPTEGSTARNLVLKTKRGTLIDYLDHLEDQMAKHIIHRNLVSSEH